jgi:tetratricopeptide (TPR) repeat protein
VVVAILAIGIGALLIAQSQTAAYDEFDSAVRSGYDYHFGPGLMSMPGNAAMADGRFLDPKAVPSAAYCGHCHQQAYAEWRQALHSNSFRTPFYRTSVNILTRTKGIEFSRHCDSCHNPIGVLSGALTSNSKVDRSFDEDGITCMVCHSIQKVTPVLGNGSYVMGAPAVMVDENGKDIAGSVPDQQIMAHPERHARAVMRDVYRTAEFCGACHKANLPVPLNGYKWIRAFTSYDEWQNSKFSRENPLTFYSADYQSCQNCHMPRELAQPNEYGAKKGTFASHRWLAGNTAVPFYYGYSEQLKQTEAFLKSGMYLNIDLFGIATEKGGRLPKPLGAVPFTLEPEQTVQAMVVVQNKNIGHSLVPEVRDLYEAWVEFIVKDRAGREIDHSGFIKPDGLLDPQAHTFTNRPVNSEGSFVDNHKVWTIHSMAYDNTIQAGRSALIRYEFRVPARACGPLTITARVNYRHLRQSYLNNVLGRNHLSYPVVELASTTRLVNIGENPPAKSTPDENSLWMRWNNLGIALLDQLQYADATAAFEQVVKMRPEYADGYVNLGLTDIDWEKYAEARGSLEKALTFAPNNARALYYLALVERREGNTSKELADLREVVRQFPESRDARRELGISYYQQHDYPRARAQFEALQAIDPDDLAAHYNLSVLYRRMGMKKQAAEQAALFAVKQVDPGAPTYSLDYLRNHPEMRVESVPWHLHRSETSKGAISGDGR